MNLKLLEVLQIIRPNAEYSVGDTFESLKWLDKTQTKPTQDEYDEGVKAYDVLDYSRKRQAEYPSVGDQMDMLMKDMKNGTTTHQTACEAVKTKYPKP